MPYVDEDAVCVLKTKCGCWRLLTWDSRIPEIHILLPNQQATFEGSVSVQNESTEHRRVFRRTGEREKIVGLLCYVYAEV